MKNSYLQPIINRLKRRSKKIIYANELKGIIQQVMGESYSDKRAYKLIYHLKNKSYLFSLKKNIFFIKRAEDSVNEQLLIEDWYWSILHTHCTDSLGKNRYIGGVKALEICFSNYEIPDEILVVCESKQSTEVVVARKLIHLKKYSSKSKELFPKFKKHTNKLKIGRYSFRYATKELAIIEALYNFDPVYDRYSYEMIKKILKKTHDRDCKVREAIMKVGKHHSSINRLYDIAKTVNPKLAEKILISIKKYSFVLDL